MRPRLYLLAVVLTSIVVGGVVAVSGALAGLIGNDGTVEAIPPGWEVPGTSDLPTPTGVPDAALESAPAGPQLDLTVDVSVDSEGFLSWAALNRQTGEFAGSDNLDKTSTTESMIKPWIVADFLRRQADSGSEPDEAQLRDASRAIRDSDDGAAERLYQAGGADQVVERMIDMCGLTDTETFPDFWSRTEISARDTVRLGECLADGTAAGPEWTDWVLEQMRKVRGSTDPADQPAGGRWGIIDGLPEQVVEQGVAIKNGWTAIGRTDSWHLACLAVTDDWVMGVLMRYPASESLDYGAERCASVAEQLLRDPGEVPEPGGQVPEA